MNLFSSRSISKQADSRPPLLVFFLSPSPPPNLSERRREMEEVGYFLPDHIGRLCVHARAIVWVWVCESEQCRTPTWPFSCLDSATKTHATQTHTHNRGAGDHTLTGEWRLKMKSGRGGQGGTGESHLRQRHRSRRICDSISDALTDLLSSFLFAAAANN